MDFADYQQRASLTDQVPDGQTALTVPMLGLAGEAAGVLSEYKKALRDGDPTLRSRSRMTEELGDVLWYLTNVATKLGLSLDEIAESNLRKAVDRWQHLSELGAAILFDESFERSEQLPRRFTAVITGAIGADGRATSRLTIDGTQIGDVLRDNAYTEDTYRYHDIMHVGFAALLGWSPVIRGFLHRKRKSNKLVDEVEDGGRAQVVEEAVAALIFDYAVGHDFLDGAGGIDTELLVTIRRLTSSLEVSRHPMAVWEQVILRIFALWRRLRIDGKVTLKADLTLRSLDPLS